MSQPLPISCPVCGQSLQLTESQFERYQGKRVKCPKCGSAIEVPITIGIGANIGVDKPFDEYDLTQQPPPPMPVPPAPPPSPSLGYQTPRIQFLRPTPSRWQDFWHFRTMLVPRIIEWNFIIGIIILPILGILGVIRGLQEHPVDGDEILAGFAIMLIGPLVLRLYCELLIVIFRINETLTEIKRTADQMQS